MNKNTTNMNKNMNTVGTWDVPITYASPVEALRAGIYTADSLDGYEVEIYRGTMNSVEVLTGATRPRIVVVTIKVNELA